MYIYIYRPYAEYAGGGGKSPSCSDDDATGGAGYSGNGSYSLGISFVSNNIYIHIFNQNPLLYMILSLPPILSNKLRRISANSMAPMIISF